MDIVFLNDLRVDVVIGISDTERRMPQKLIFDMELGTDLRRAGESDELSSTIDYRAVAERVAEHAGTSRYELLESLAESTASIVMKEFGAAWCRIRIAKRGVVPGVRDVGIVIERGARG